MLRSKRKSVVQLSDIQRDRATPVYAKAAPSRIIRFAPSYFATTPVLVHGLAAAVLLVAVWFGVAKVKASVPWWCFPAAATIVLARVWWLVLFVRSHRVTIEPARLTFHRGVLNRAVYSLEFTRIKNVSSFQRWWERPFGIGTVRVESTDWNHRYYALHGMADPHHLREQILRAGIASRQFHGTTETWVSGF
ncbi:PH domain-containing protein [Burkholderia cepacia]|uniref:PH domain-containing protein n=1 Tax=Burkholderia cepacia TaxID=292 RepID=UPI002ABD6A51|nr:PH domain-containing protein [Burkholderia cepacia]